MSICQDPACDKHYGCRLRRKGLSIAAGGIRKDQVASTVRGPDGTEKHTQKRHESTGDIGGVEMTRSDGRVDVTVTPPPVAVQFGLKS